MRDMFLTFFLISHQIIKTTACMGQAAHALILEFYPTLLLCALLPSTIAMRRGSSELFVIFCLVHKILKIFKGRSTETLYRNFLHNLPSFSYKVKFYYVPSWDVAWLSSFANMNLDCPTNLILILHVHDNTILSSRCLICFFKLSSLYTNILTLLTL